MADWIVVALYLLGTTLLGARLAGKQANIRDFFLGGRKLPWWAISGSIIATEISAVTFIAVPTISFAEGGNLTYLQLAVGSILARIIIGYYFVPRYYQREIYSPYDYMGNQLGPRVKTITTLLFFVGAILGQGARIYVTAFVLSAITGLNLTSSIWIMGIFSVGWTLLGGMTTVIWTDVIQFCVLTVGAILVLGFAIAAAPGSMSSLVADAADVGKFQLLDVSLNPATAYTLWCGLLAAPFLNLAALGTDQVMAQRMFCCRNESDARKAILVSSVGVGIALLMLLVGVTLYAYYTPGERAAFDTKNIRETLLPAFIVQALPVGVRGIIIAAVFASAVSSLDSALAALSQSTASAFIQPIKRRARSGWRKYISSQIALSKVLVVAWGAVLCLMATACIVIADQFDNAVDLALGLVGYTYGPLLGIFLLALFGIKRSDAGLTWAVPMAMLAVFAVSQHNLNVNVAWFKEPIDISDWIVWLGSAAVLVLALLKLAAGAPTRIAAIVVATLAIVCLHQYEAGTGPDGKTQYLAFPWWCLIGTVMTFTLACALRRPKRAKRAAARHH